MTKYKLDFVAVGPFKTATSWMDAYLRNHKQVSLPISKKETFFFNLDNNYSRGLDDFFADFDLTNDSKKVGEFAPAYFTSMSAIKRINQLNPDCTIIVSLREPISQLTSFYLHKVSRRELSKNITFVEALEQQFDLLDNASYYTHLSRWIEAFGRDRVKIIFYDLLVENAQEYTNDLCQIIGVESLTIPKQIDRKVGAYNNYFKRQLMKLVAQISKVFKSIGLTWIIQLAKKIGVPELLEGNGSTSPYQPDKAEINYAFRLLVEEMKKLETELGLNLNKWRQDWRKYGIDSNILP